jgi:D-alanine-D-alanine ligase
MGGQSAERDVSIRSGTTVALRLASPPYAVKPVLIRDDGRWEVPAGFLGEGLSLRAEDWFRGAPLPVEEALGALRSGTDVVFIALHGPMGEDGTVQGLLEVLGIPYTGPEVTAAAVTMDKRLTKDVIRAAGIPTPRSFPVNRLAPRGGGRIAWPVILDHGLRSFPLPWVLKPNRLGSSVGITIARSADDFLRLAVEAERFLPWAAPGATGEERGELLIEEFVAGRELTCGVVSMDGAPRPLPPIEIRPVGHSFFDYEAKYTPGATEEICPAPVSPDVTARVQELAVAVHQALGADPLSRTDFILDASGTPQVLELNAIPGMTATSLIPLSAGKAGIDLGDLLAGIVEHGLRRAGRKGRL